MARFSAEPILGLPEVDQGFKIGSAIAEKVSLEDGDVIAISQKIISKAEGQVVRLSEVNPGTEAAELAELTGKDPKLTQCILDQSRELVRVDAERGILITETIHGFICANAGIDQSNTAGVDEAILLPEDPDRSARLIRAEIEGISARHPAVIITDSFGRAWRQGQSEIAIGCAGIHPLDDWRGRSDQRGRELSATVIAVADQIAAASDLVRSKTDGIPAVRIRGLERFVTEEDGPGCAAQLRGREDDLFR